MGNRIQSCALSVLNSADAQVQFVKCFMNVFIKKKNNEEHGQSVS